jgi:hypothetical protein
MVLLTTLALFTAVLSAQGEMNSQCTLEQTIDFNTAVALATSDYVMNLQDMAAMARNPEMNVAELTSRRQLIQKNFEASIKSANDSLPAACKREATLGTAGAHFDQCKGPLAAALTQAQPAMQSAKEKYAQTGDRESFEASVREIVRAGLQSEPRVCWYQQPQSEQSGSTFNTHNCDAATSRLVAHAYVLSIPLMSDENDLMSFMNSNPGNFTEGGAAIRCMQSLGNALVNRGMAMSNQFSGQPATSIFGGRMPGGLAQLPGQVDSALRSYGTDWINLGQELRWLSQVLPPAARGNFSPYNTTGTVMRQNLRQTLAIYCQSDARLCQTVQAILFNAAPTEENLIYTLAVTSDN